jgi:hypothetical protein
LINQYFGLSQLGDIMAVERLREGEAPSAPELKILGYFCIRCLF